MFKIRYAWRDFLMEKFKNNHIKRNHKNPAHEEPCAKVE